MSAHQQNLWVYVPRHPFVYLKYKITKLSELINWLPVSIYRFLGLFPPITPSLLIVSPPFPQLRCFLAALVERGENSIAPLIEASDDPPFHEGDPQSNEAVEVDGNLSSIFLYGDDGQSWYEIGSACSNSAKQS